VDAREVVGQLVDGIDLTEEGAGKHLQIEVVSENTPQWVKVDVISLRKALAYLIRYLAHNSPAEQAKVSISVGPHEDEHGGTDVRVLVGSRTASVSSEALQRLFDPVHMVQESLIDVGPAVSQRLIEALGGRLRTRQTRHELSFLVTLPSAT
jgi:C4-dicarboxylate-specific signal transduction histidine kinase